MNLKIAGDSKLYFGKSDEEPVFAGMSIKALNGFSVN
jgi:hypothetical protein